MDQGARASSVKFEPSSSVIAGLDPAIRAALPERQGQQRIRWLHVDARIKSAHDGGGDADLWLAAIILQCHKRAYLERRPLAAGSSWHASCERWRQSEADRLRPRATRPRTILRVWARSVRCRGGRPASSAYALGGKERRTGSEAQSSGRYRRYARNGAARSACRTERQRSSTDLSNRDSLSPAIPSRLMFAPYRADRIPGFTAKTCFVTQWN